MVKTWSQLGTIVVNSSCEHKNYHHQMPALIAPCSNPDCGQPQGHHAAPPANGTRLLVTTMWRPLNCPSVSTPVDTSSFPETPGIVSASPKNNQGMNHWYDKNLQCRIESNQLSRTAVRGLFWARFVRLFCFPTSSSEVGAPSSNSEPDTSVRGNPGSVAWTTGSPERLYTKTQQPHEVIFMFQRAAKLAK